MINIQMLGSNRNLGGDPLYGRQQQQANPQRANNGAAYPQDQPRAGIPARNVADQSGNEKDALNRSRRNPINNVELNEASVRGDGANIISDRLNFGGVKKIIEGAPQVVFVPKEVVKEVEVEEVVPGRAQVILDDSVNANARNILAESMAKVALLIMENNRLKWVESQRNAEIARLTSAPPVVIQQPVRQVVVQAPKQVIRVQGPPIYQQANPVRVSNYSPIALPQIVNGVEVRGSNYAPIALPQVVNGVEVRASNYAPVRVSNYGPVRASNYAPIALPQVVNGAPVRVSGYNVAAPVARVVGQTAASGLPTVGSDGSIRRSSGYTTAGQPGYFTGTATFGATTSRVVGSPVASQTVVGGPKVANPFAVLGSRVEA